MKSHHCKELDELIKTVEKDNNFRVCHCKTGKVKIYSNGSSKRMYTVHKGKKALMPLTRFIEKNKNDNS
jgi:hypothetical protein